MDPFMVHWAGPINCCTFTIMATALAGLATLVLLRASRWIGPK